MQRGGNATSRFTFSPGNANAMTARMGVISDPSALLSHAHRSSVAFVPSFERCFVLTSDMPCDPLLPRKAAREPPRTATDERSLPQARASGQGAHSLTLERSDSEY